ncbi:MAG: ATP-dependent helicase/nuclease subunit A, partial [Planctomycetota bacterium]
MDTAAQPVQTESRIPSDQAMRTRFRTVLDRNAVVEAGAGTGKTTLVVERILCLVMGRDIGERGAAYPSSGLPILAAPIPIERIVAITFTELAAGELASRVRDRMTEVLASARQAGDSATEQLLVAALADLPRASITTIHGFCSRILREYALEAG